MQKQELGRRERSHSFPDGFAIPTKAGNIQASACHWPVKSEENNTFARIFHHKWHFFRDNAVTLLQTKQTCTATVGPCRLRKANGVTGSGTITRDIWQQGLRGKDNPQNGEACPDIPRFEDFDAIGDKIVLDPFLDSHVTEGARPNWPTGC